MALQARQHQTQPIIKAPEHIFNTHKRQTYENTLKAIPKKLRIRISSFFMNLVELNQLIEINRQFLNSMHGFEPYAAYLRLCKPPKVDFIGCDHVLARERQLKGITAQHLADFLKENGFEVSYASLKNVIMIFDASLEGKLDFEDFLKMVLS